MRHPNTGANLVHTMIDLHNHLLPGIDDGPADLHGALEMARTAVGAGIATMVCTPHMSHRYPATTGRVIQDAVAALADELRQAEIPLEIVAGAELTVEVVRELNDRELLAASLGQSGWLMIESPFEGWPIRLAQMIAELEIRGFRVIIAHPERAEAIQHSPDRLRDLVGRGALVQSNASSFLGGHGRLVAQTVENLMRNELIHVLASDAHSAEWRPPGLEEARARAARLIGVWPQELDWMINDGPRQILSGGQVRPPRFLPREKAPPPNSAEPAPARGPRH
jgi:protein-tyrosine phosphatase